ncbi:MAG: TonB-dependent receptor plug domain-containing protein, partial [Candidatus Andersenbacteria bacterium]
MKLTKIHLLCLLALLLSASIQAQDITINGLVNDNSGLPIAGAAVLLKNTTKGATTDFDGKFQIIAPSDGILVFSYIGYATLEASINGQNNLTVTLNESNESLDEVVVVGYGTQKKSVVTGAISSIKQSDLEDLPVTRIEQSLQGRVSGLTIAANSGQPGSSSTIRIRGITTFGNNEPLWVVDGVVVDAGGIGYLNQSDIASVEVLKDAASQAIYGARAATGVILITTKKGSRSKLSVSYTGYAGVSGTARKLDLLNATEY